MTVGEQVNKVLEMHTSEGSDDTLVITPTQLLENATGVTFQTDLMFNPTNDSATFYLEPLNGEGKQAFRLIVKAVKDGNVTVSVDGVTETVIGESGKWINLKVDYMNPLADYDGDRRLDILYKVYVGNSTEPVATYYKPYGVTSYYEPLEIAQYKITMPAESVADIIIDNTRFWQTELIPDKAPEFEYSEEGALGGGYTGDKFDGNGWS